MEKYHESYVKTSGAVPEVLRVAKESRLIVFGAVLVLLALYAPRGLCGLAQGLSRRFGRKAPVHADHS